jgi:hypothetical protein
MLINCFQIVFTGYEKQSFIAGYEKHYFVEGYEKQYFVAGLRIKKLRLVPPLPLSRATDSK